MVNFFVRRLILAMIAVLGVLIITFTISHVIPGDPARAVAGRWATEEQIQAVRKDLGLDKPLFVQFGCYLNDLAHGKLGSSIVSQRPIVNELKDYFPPTLELVLVAMFVNITLAIPLGVIAAVKRGLYGRLHILPLGGRLNLLTVPPVRITGMYILDSFLTGNWTVFSDALAHVIMPAFTLGLAFVAVIMRIVRSSMLTVLNTDYIRTARAKGLSESVVIYKHGLKNAIIPPLTIVGMQLGWMMGGTVLVETVFSWGGMGFWAVMAIRQSDFPVTMAVTLIISLLFIVANFCVDLLYTVVDPRIRYT